MAKYALVSGNRAILFEEFAERYLPLLGFLSEFSWDDALAAGVHCDAFYAAAEQLHGANLSRFEKLAKAGIVSLRDTPPPDATILANNRAIAEDAEAMRLLVVKQRWAVACDDGRWVRGYSPERGALGVQGQGPLGDWLAAKGYVTVEE